MIKQILILLMILSCINTFSKTEDEIIEGKKRAVLLITTYNKQTNKRIEQGTGFFSDSKGHFITNRHVLETFLSDIKKYSVSIRSVTGKEFFDIEVIKCGDNQSIDICYGKIVSDEKIFFFDVLSKTPVKKQALALIGHNIDFFSVKKGEVSNIVDNLSDKYGAKAGDSKNISMIEIGGYDCPASSCKGDSGAPVFDRSSGDLIGVFAETYRSKISGELFKYAINTNEVVNFIGNNLKPLNLKIPKESIYQVQVNEKKAQQSDDIGHEFDEEKKRGKLD